MANQILLARLQTFRVENKIIGKGALAVVVHITRQAHEIGLPLAADSLITDGSGQVLGLGKGAVQKILKEHGITQVLAEEGGRTSRGSIGIMREYVVFLNQLYADKLAALAMIEAWWIEQVRAHFTAKPFRLRFDPAVGFQTIIHDLLSQAKKRQQAASGAMYQGTMLQHLIGAKLELVMPEIEIIHNGASVADTVSGRSGDFVIDDSVIHITTAPSEALIRKCQRNIDAGLKPIIITLSEGVVVAQALAGNAQLAGRVDILDAVQFLAGNLHELSLFKVAARQTTLTKLVEAYNRIVDANETDSSLLIEMG